MYPELTQGTIQGTTVDSEEVPAKQGREKEVKTEQVKQIESVE